MLRPIWEAVGFDYSTEDAASLEKDKKAALEEMEHLIGGKEQGQRRLAQSIKEKKYLAVQYVESGNDHGLELTARKILQMENRLKQDTVAIQTMQKMLGHAIQRDNILDQIKHMRTFRSIAQRITDQNNREDDLEDVAAGYLEDIEFITSAADQIEKSLNGAEQKISSTVGSSALPNEENTRLATLIAEIKGMVTTTKPASIHTVLPSLPLHSEEMALRISESFPEEFSSKPQSKPPKRQDTALSMDTFTFPLPPGAGKEGVSQKNKIK